MNVVVFLGPTLPRHEAESVLHATYLPPVSQGDVYSVARKRPWAIVIVDGYFDRVPAVWHKEILWAMARGIHVFGCSSMGALRAAELEPFGMVGVGRVFEAFKDGTLEDDDEVTIVHGPADAGYVTGSAAMVNMRATFAAARDAGVIDAETCDTLIALAKRTFYPDRAYDRVLTEGRTAGLPATDCDALERWLPIGRVDLKRADALATLTRIRGLLAQGADPKQVDFRFHGTFMWEELRNAIERRPMKDYAGADTALDDNLLEELRLEGDTYQRERDRALVRMLSVELGLRSGTTAGAVVRHVTTQAVRSSHGLHSQEDLDRWLSEQQITPNMFDRLMEHESLYRIMRTRYVPNASMYLRDHLRIIGRYGELGDRARDKQALLSRRGLRNPALADAGLSESELWRWFFESLLGREVPDDLAAFATALDFSDIDMMRRAALREFLYLRRLPQRDGAAEAATSRPVAGSGVSG